MTSTKSEVGSISIAEKNTKLTLSQKSDLNKKNLTIKAEDSGQGNLYFPGYEKKLTLDLGKKSDVKITIGTQNKAEMVVKEADATAKLSVVGKDSDAAIKKIVLNKPVSLSVDANTELLQIKEGAKKAVVTINNKVEKIQNKFNATIEDNTEKDKAEEETEKEEDAKKEESKELSAPENGGAASGGGSSSGGGSNTGGGSSDSGSSSIAVESLQLNGNANISTDDGLAEISVQYSPANASSREVEWRVISGGEQAKIISSDNNKAVVQALDNGQYTLRAAVRNNPAVFAEISGKTENQKVSLAKGSMGTAGDGEISGLASGYGYILAGEGEYFSVASTGLFLAACQTEEEAIGRVGLLTGNSILKVDNAKVFRVIQIDSERLLRKQYEIYMAIEEKDLSISNFIEIGNMARDLGEAVEKKEMESADGAEKNQWKNMSKKIEEKENSLRKKYDELAAESMKVKAELEVIYDRIKEDIEPGEAKEILALIDAKKEELLLSETWIEEYIDDDKEEQYQILKKDLEDFEEISNYHIKVELDEKGIASIEPVVQGLVVDLIKKGNEADQNEVVTSKSLTEGTSQVSMLQEMRNSGVGNYFVRVRKEQKVFVLLKDFEVASNVQEVKKLESNFELLRLEGSNFDIVKKSANIRID